MKDAGCDNEIITKIYRLYAEGQIQDAVKILRRHRCSLMEQLHKSQNRVYCLDFLIRQMESKERQVMQNGRGNENGIDKRVG